MTNETEATAHQGTEPAPCETCQGEGYVPVRVPVTGDMEADAGMAPGSGGYVTEGEPCMDCNRSGEAPGGGMARLQRDVIPPDQTAGGLLAQMSVLLSSVLVDASTLQGDLERLAVLLEARDAAVGDLVTALVASREARLATGRQSTCDKQAHGDSHIQCGKCFICLERKALAARGGEA